MSESTCCAPPLQCAATRLGERQERGLFQSELELAGLRRQELASIVERYRALGGGWTPALPPQP